MNVNLELTTVIRMLHAKTPMEVMNVNAMMVLLVMESYAMVSHGVISLQIELIINTSPKLDM